MLAYVSAMVKELLYAFIAKTPETAMRCRESFYRGRTDDVMKLLMIGFEGLFHLCNPSSHKWDGTPLVDRAGLGF